LGRLLPALITKNKKWRCFMEYIIFKINGINVNLVDFIIFTTGFIAALYLIIEIFKNKKPK
jgi:hypothetical protein